MTPEQRDSAHVETVVAWLLPSQPNLRDEPQAYKAALLRAGAEGMLAYVADRSKAQAVEIARLREALKHYEAGCDWQTPPPHCDRPDHLCCKTARAALNGETP